jgi:hypothetical protein
MEVDLKLSRILFAASLLCFAALIALVPAIDVVAQDNTPQPVVTATPQPEGGAEGTPTEAAAASDRPREMRALDVARAALAKKLNRPLSYFKYLNSWTWELTLFKDSALGCPADGQTATPGDYGGYLITITTLDGKQYEVHVTYDLTVAYVCPQIGGTTTASGGLPAPVGGKAVGGAFEAGGQIQDFNGNTVAKMRDAGMKWVKRQLKYPDGAGPGIISAAKAQGFKTLLSVIGEPGEVLSPGFFDKYAAYVGGLAASGADAIEIWNEANLDREWPKGQISPQKYTELLAKSYNAIKAANGNTIVILGAPAPTGAAGPGGKTDAYWNDDVFYTELGAAGAGQYADCIGIHYNEGIVSPTQSSGDSRDSYPTRYYSTMLNRALAPFGGKQGCFTELGYLSPEGYGPLPGGFAWGKDTSAAEQAQWLREAAVLSAQSGRVRLMIVFNVDFSFYGADPQAGYAMIRPGNVCPACEQLAQVLK